MEQRESRRRTEGRHARVWPRESDCRCFEGQRANPTAVRVADLVLRLSRRQGGDDLEESVSNLASVAEGSTARPGLILAKLSEPIDKKESVVYGAVPHGLERRENRRYAEVNRITTTIQAAAKCVLLTVGPAGVLDQRWVMSLGRSGMLDRLGMWRGDSPRMWKLATEASEMSMGVYQKAPVNPQVTQGGRESRLCLHELLLPGRRTAGTMM